MALSVSTQDLENYPGTAKTVTSDTTAIVPIGYEADEQYVYSVSTSAYSDNVNRTAIQTLYITDTKAGWAKSSGFTGVGGKFLLKSDQYQIKVKIDATVSGTDGNGYYTIDLEYQADGVTRTPGAAIADDMETKIRALADSLETADTGFSLAYASTTVNFVNNKFEVRSGSIGEHWTGSSRSSVSIIAADTNDCSEELGFNLGTTSEELAAITVPETYLASNYTAGATTMTVAAGTNVSAGKACMITDGTNTDYFVAASGTTDTSIALSSDVYLGVANSYVANEAKVQILKYQDPDNEPLNHFDSVDDIIRHGIKYIMNQIDYSS